MTDRKNAYHYDFPDWASVSKNFSGQYGDDGATAISKPQQVIWAGYTYEDYSGDALVVYRDKGKFYVVNGGHCSCYGLEGQWEPEEYETADLLRGAVERGWTYGLMAEAKAVVLKAVSSSSRASRGGSSTPLKKEGV